MQASLHFAVIRPKPSSKSHFPEHAPAPQLMVAPEHESSVVHVILQEALVGQKNVAPAHASRAHVISQGRSGAQWNVDPLQESLPHAILQTPSAQPPTQLAGQSAVDASTAGHVLGSPEVLEDGRPDVEPLEPLEPVPEDDVLPLDEDLPEDEVFSLPPSSSGSSASPASGMPPLYSLRSHEQATAIPAKAAPSSGMTRARITPSWHGDVTRGERSRLPHR